MPCPVSFTCDIVQCFKIYERDIHYCIFPDKNKNKLRDDMEKLMNEKNLVEAIVDRHIEVHPRDKCHSRVKNWIMEVCNLNEEAEALLESLSRVEDSRCCFRCKSNRSLGQRTTELIEKIDRQYQERPGDNLIGLVEPAPPPQVKYVPSSTFEVIGMEGHISEILAHLQNPDIQIIGIYGTGGVGKTTLMTELNNVLLKEKTQGFDYIIWITISHDANTQKIQYEISKRMGYQLPDDLEERSSYLLECLSSGKKFLFLMDDVWHRLDLKEIGIPVQHFQRNCRVIFTTRYLDVCRSMDSQKKVEVQCLDWNNSWKLFLKNLDENVDLNDQCIKKCVQFAARKCRGLPLALKVLAKAVRNCSTIFEWQHVVQRLQSSPSMIDGMGEELFHILKYSFDNLNPKNLQLCLLYCSLYPEDDDIHMLGISHLWDAEGILGDEMENGTSGTHYRNKASYIISKLKDACLLERSPLGDFAFRLHDIIRGMCLWITDSKNNGDNIFEVWNPSSIYCGADCADDKVKKWKDATKVSCIGSKIQGLGNQTPECPKLVTLLLGRCEGLQDIHHGFFHFMPSLRVLDLRDTEVKEVPSSISFLCQLQYLNLSGTKIKVLPVEVGNLTQLIYLYLYRTPELIIVPKDVLSHLRALKHLDMSKSRYKLRSTEEEGYDRDLFNLEDLLSLKKLERLEMDINSKKGLEYLISDSFFQKIMYLCVLHGPDVQDVDLIKATRRFSYLTLIEIASCLGICNIIFYGCYLIQLEGIKLIHNTNLRSVTLKEEEEVVEGTCDLRQLPQWYIPFGNLWLLDIERCPLRSLSFVTQLMTLKALRVAECQELEDIVPMDDHRTFSTQELPLQKLTSLNLRKLPNLRNICGFHLSSLSSVRILYCPKLTRLPFKRESCMRATIIGSGECADEM